MELQGLIIKKDGCKVLNWIVNKYISTNTRHLQSSTDNGIIPLLTLRSPKSYSAEG